MKRLLFLLVAAALFTACKKDNNSPAPVTTPYGDWKAIDSGYHIMNIRQDSLYTDGATYFADSITIAGSLIIKEYRHSFPDTSYMFDLSKNGDTLHLKGYYDSWHESYIRIGK